MIEAIQVIRDVIIILSFVIITSVVVIVGRAILHLVWEIEDVGEFAAATVSSVVNPVKSTWGVLCALSRRIRG